MHFSYHTSHRSLQFDSYVSTPNHERFHDLEPSAEAFASMGFGKAMQDGIIFHQGKVEIS